MHALHGILDRLIHRLDVRCALTATLTANHAPHLVVCRVSAHTVLASVLHLRRALSTEGLVVREVESVNHQTVFLALSIQVLLRLVPDLSGNHS